MSERWYIKKPTRFKNYKELARTLAASAQATQSQPADIEHITRILQRIITAHNTEGIQKKIRPPLDVQKAIVVLRLLHNFSEEKTTAAHNLLMAGCTIHSILEAIDTLEKEDSANRL